MSLDEKNYTPVEVKLLEKWGKSAKNYFLLHDKAHNEYMKKNYGLTIPVIILSTLSGTASFSIQSFPESIRGYVPMMIGGINIFVGILQTMTQFMKINELVSEHRIAAINFDKFSRNIMAELSLPENERTYSGKDFVHICRKEMDRIIEQSPIIPERILSNLEALIKSDTITNNQNKIVGYDEIFNKTFDNDTITIDMKQINELFTEKINKITNKITNDVVIDVKNEIVNDGKNEIVNDGKNEIVNDGVIDVQNEKIKTNNENIENVVLDYQDVSIEFIEL